LLADTLDLLQCPCCAESAPLRITDDFVRAGAEWIEAMLGCEGCGRWYRVEAGIPDLVRDELREVEDELRFLERHREAIGAARLAQLEPIRPGREHAEPSESDRRIIEEGRHWGRFMARFWDVGDRSIFDLRIKGTHPSFFVAGVLEPDDRDAWRPWSMFPPAVGDMCFHWLHHLEGKRGVDVGCGGGQFGLEAARRGVRMIGFDPSFEEVMLARRHAREQGIRTIDYVRAEPANPPFRTGVFDLFMAKDSLHHVPGLDIVMPRLLSIAAPNAHVLIHEHVAKAELKGRLMGRLMPRAVEKIRRRWPKTEIPAELLRDSANEDVSAHLVRPLMEQFTDRIHSVESLFLAEELEMTAHYAFGKRRWVTAVAYVGAWWLERLLLALGDRQHLTWHGTRR
jgi:2-polyprenyl-6-hydroxyphenyl methylase/3-demethylubiquinone-9 3-methyltransferase